MNLYTDYPNLARSLGPKNAVKVQAFILPLYTPSSKRVRMTPNPHRQRLLANRASDAQAIDDILTGVSSLDYGNDKGISRGSLLAVLCASDTISSERIEQLLGICARQARRYLAGAKLAIHHLNRHFTGLPLASRSPTLQEIRNAHTV